MRHYCSVLIVSLSSPPTHDELVADILWDSGNLQEQVVEIRRVGEEFVTTIFPKGDGQPWHLALTEFQGALERAGNDLANRLGTS